MSKKKYAVSVYAHALVSAVVDVEADSPEQAKELAVKEAEEDFGAQDWEPCGDVERDDVDGSLTDLESDVYEEKA